MGKVVKGIIGVGFLALATFATGGLATALGTGLLKLGILTKGFFVATGLALTTSALIPMPKIPRSQLSRLNARLDPNASRKGVVGETALPIDLRYHEGSGENQSTISYILSLAAHTIESVDEIYFEDKKAWDSTSGVTSTYKEGSDSYITAVDVVLEGNESNYVSVGTGWGSDDLLFGCAYIHIQIKRDGYTKKTQSPLVQGLPSRITIRGKGAKLYDPRLDSTVSGGSGSHRADDQTTWGSYNDADDKNNPVLQLLFFLLGWKINNKLSIGCGVPPARLDLESFITAANIADESVTLEDGSTQKKYRSAGTFGDSDDRMGVIETFLTSMNGTLRDEGGKLTLHLFKNDLTVPVLQFVDDDVLSEFNFDQTGGGISENKNVIRGRYTDPSDQALYQQAEYNQQSIDSLDDIERVMSFDLPFIEDGRRAQRIAKQALQRQQFRAQFQATFSAKALGCEVGDFVTLSFTPLGFNNKYFRVISKEVRVDGQVPLILLEEDPVIYSWDREDTAPVVPSLGTVYEPLNNSITQGDLAVANTVVTFTEVPPVEIQADSEGTTTTALPVTTDITTFIGGVAQTSGVTLGSVTSTGGITASASVSSGVVTVSISAADASGNITVPIIVGGITYNRTVHITRTLAAPISGGESGSTSFTDQSWTNISTTSYITVTDADSIVRSDSSGDLRFSASAAYTGTGTAQILAQYSTDNVSFTDVGTVSTGTAASGIESPGFVSIAATTVATGSNNTDFYVRLRAKRQSGSGTLSWAGANFTVKQP